MRFTQAISFSVVAFSVVLVSQSASAGDRDPGVNHRQHHQHHRIQEGVRSGELTREEAHTLRSEQRDIRAKERSYKSDGELTRAERRDLHHELNEASQNIHEEKHDAEQRHRARK